MEEERGLTRIGVSMPSNLLNKFDKIIRGRGYSSRSEGIRDSIRAYLIEYEWMEREYGEEIGTITYIYDSGQRGLRDELAKVQYRYIGLVKTATHIHLDKENCFETVVMKGDAKKIKTFVEDIMSLRGVKHVKLTTTRSV